MRGRQESLEESGTRRIEIDTMDRNRYAGNSSLSVGTRSPAKLPSHRSTAAGRANGTGRELALNLYATYGLSQEDEGDSECRVFDIKVKPAFNESIPANKVRVGPMQRQDQII